MSDKLSIALEAMRILSKYDCCDDIFWRCDGEYAPLMLLVNCNDVFGWACADAEPITDTNIGMLADAYEDAQNSGDLGIIYGSMLFCARSRGERPQGACYPENAKGLWPLLNACGPERPVDSLNPYRPGTYKPIRPADAKDAQIATLNAKLARVRDGTFPHDYLNGLDLLPPIISLEDAARECANAYNQHDAEAAHGATHYECMLAALRHYEKMKAEGRV
jgi:hypothetical protein